MRDPAFIVTGGCGSLGGACAKDILAKGGYVAVSMLRDDNTSCV
jgi:NAD(P)-dependent dehydrogenase (short-subunit alcohol dehydrogenase family)